MAPLGRLEDCRGRGCLVKTQTGLYPYPRGLDPRGLAWRGLKVISDPLHPLGSDMRPTRWRLP